jgi:hypothetical protein
MNLMGQSNDVDMGTLAEILRNLAQGRHIDTTPFGTWGVRDMNPTALGGLMNAAQGEWTKTQASREAADALRRQSQDRLAGQLDTNDVAYQNALTHLLGTQNTLENQWGMAQEKNKTELEKERLGVAGRKDVAETMAGTKTGKVPDMLQMQMVKVFQNPKWKPEEVQPFVDMLRMNKLNDAADYYQKVVDTRKNELAKNPPAASDWGEKFNPVNLGEQARGSGIRPEEWSPVTLGEQLRKLSGW